jgi:phosphatidylglycerol:prolipoprotein diacylglycerol transferase
MIRTAFFPLADPHYPLMLSLSVTGGLLTTVLVARRYLSVPPWRLLVGLLVLTAVSLLGARVHFLLAHPDLAPGRWGLGSLGQGGFHTPGGLIGFACGLPLAGRIAGVPTGRFADTSIVGSMVALAIHRVGCLLRGCCAGDYCTYPWCIPYTNKSFTFLLHVHRGLVESTAATSAPIHPLPVYYMVLCLACAGLALARLPRRRFDGEVALLVLCAFGAGTAVLESFRAATPDRVVVFGGWPQLMVGGVLLAVISSILLVIASALRRGTPPVDATGSARLLGSDEQAP